MERNDKIEFAIIFATYGWVLVSDIVLAGHRDIQFASKVLSMAGMFCYLIIGEAYYTVVASKFMHLQLIIRPTNKKLSLFVKRGGFRTVAANDGSNLLSTTLPLGVKKKIPPYGDIEKIILTHEYPFDERVIPSHGKANYKGNIVDHHATATLVVYESPEGPDVEKSAPVPTYYLKDAPGDYGIGPISPMVVGLNSNVQATLQKLATKNQELKRENIKVKNRASYWHQLAIQLDNMVKNLKEELSGLLRNSPDFERGIVRYCQGYAKDIEDILQLAKRGSFFRTFFKPWMGLLIFGIGFILFLYTQPELLMGVGNFFANPANQFWLIIITCIGVAGVYYVGKIIKKRRS